MHFTPENCLKKTVKISDATFQVTEVSQNSIIYQRVIPLSNEIKKKRTYIYQASNRFINHLFYINDLKLFLRCDKESEGLLTTLKQLRVNICMEFDLEKNKGAKATFKRCLDKLVTISGSEIANNIPKK